MSCACALLTATLLVGCDGRARNEGAPELGPSDPHVAEIDLSEGIPEEAASGLFGSNGPTLSELVLDLHELGSDDAVRGVFVRFGLTSVGLAEAEALGRALAAVPEDRPVVCHADGYGNGTMLLAATGCDEIWVSPAGGVETVGIAAQLLFGKALLERLHVDVDFLQEGKYKGAEEPYTRNSASPEARTSLQSALGALRAAWRQGIARGRSKPAEVLGLEDGPHTPQAAVELGLVDSIGYEREAKEHVQQRAGVSDTLDHLDGKEDGPGLLSLLGGGDGLDAPHVAIVPATGAITSGGGGLLSGGDGIAERSLSKTLRELREDDAVVAVVLRIDSPGGSALASDRLWTHLTALREEKPLVISIGGMAASGGYYMACAGTRIVAEKSSIIGSIGVVGGKLSFSRSLAEVGIHVEAIPAVEGGSERALYGSPFAPWDEATRAKVAESMHSMYELFIQRIATGRGMDEAAIEPHAEGRLMGGERAVEAGLVDEIGGVRRAVELARELAGAPEDTAIEVVGRGGGLIDLLSGPEASAALPPALELRRRLLGDTVGALLVTAQLHRTALTRYLASTLPLLEGEHLLVAVPFAVTVR